LGIEVNYKINRLTAWAIVVAGTVVLNALFYTLVRLEGCTPGVGYGIPMGGGECQPLSESYFGFVGFMGDLWFLLMGWPSANILLGLFLCKKFSVSKLLVFPVIFVLAIGTGVIFYHLFPSSVPD
jgi:hypothetical protein